MPKRRILGSPGPVRWVSNAARALTWWTWWTWGRLRTRSRHGLSEIPLPRHREILENFYPLPASRKESAPRAWRIFKQNPFNPRLGAHRIQQLSAIMRRTVYAVVIEGDLWAVFYLVLASSASSNPGLRLTRRQDLFPCLK